MPTWNCTNCEMPMTLVENITNVTCPNCGKRMIEVSDKTQSQLLWSLWENLTSLVAIAVETLQSTMIKGIREKEENALVVRLIFP